MKEKEIFQITIFLLITIFLVNALIPFFTGSEKPMIVLSGSMVPMMLPGDLIVSRSISPEDLAVGDVIIFKDPWGKNNTFITHRIVSLEEREERIFQTKGDANNVEDDFKVPASNIVGRLIFVIPFAGYLPEVLKNKYIYLFTIVLPAGLIILEEIKTLALCKNPVRARKVELEQKKIAWRTSYVIKGKRLAALILISGLISTGIVMHNLGENGHVVLGKEKTIENQGFLPLVYVLTPEDSRQRINIHFWYGVVTPANETQVIAPENTHAMISSVPYILPVFWIISFAEINPYLPALAEIGLYTFCFSLLLLPVWYRKSVVGRKCRKVKFRRLVAQWKKSLRFI